MTIRGRGRGQGSHTLSQLRPIQCHVGPSELDLSLYSPSIIVESTLNFCMYLTTFIFMKDKWQFILFRLREKKKKKGNKLALSTIYSLNVFLGATSIDGNQSPRTTSVFDGGQSNVNSTSNDVPTQDPSSVYSHNEVDRRLVISVQKVSRP